MNRYLSRIRDAWEILAGRKVAVDPSSTVAMNVTMGGSTNGNLIYDNRFVTGPGWTFTGNSLTE